MTTTLKMPRFILKAYQNFPKSNKIYTSFVSRECCFRLQDVKQIIHDFPKVTYIEFYVFYEYFSQIKRLLEKHSITHKLTPF